MPILLLHSAQQAVAAIDIATNFIASDPLNSTTKFYNVPAGVTTDLVGVLVLTGAQSTAFTISPDSPDKPAAVFTQIATSVAGNSYVSTWLAKGLAAGDRIHWNSTSVLSVDVGSYWTNRYTGLGTVGAIGIRSASTTTTTSGALTAAAGSKVLFIATERTTADGTSVSSVSVSTGEPVTQRIFAEEPTALDNSYYIGELTALGSGSRTATVTYSGGSGNGWSVLARMTPNSALSAPAALVHRSKVYIGGAWVIKAANSEGSPRKMKIYSGGTWS